MDQTPTDGSRNRSLSEEGHETAAWQRKLLPLMSSTLILLAVFACATNFYEVLVMQRHIQATQAVDLAPAWDVTTLDNNAAFSDRFACAQWRTLALLESRVIESRYRQAAVAMMGRVYIVFMGFATGMVMALVGAAFILGKLREPGSSLSASSSSWQVALQSTSPGLFLALFGTILIITTILARSDVNVHDGPLYIQSRTIDQTQSASPPVATQTPENILNKVRQVEAEKAKTNK